MDEQKTKPENTTSNPNSGNQPQGLDKVERAEQAVKRMEEAEARIDEKIAKLAELQADRILAGTAGGRVEPQAPKKMSNVEYANKLMRGEVNPLKDDDISIN